MLALLGGATIVVVSRLRVNVPETCGENNTLNRDPYASKSLRRRYDYCIARLLRPVSSIRCNIELEDRGIFDYVNPLNPRGLWRGSASARLLGL